MYILRNADEDTPTNLLRNFLGKMWLWLLHKTVLSINRNDIANLHVVVGKYAKFWGKWRSKCMKSCEYNKSLWRKTFLYNLHFSFILRLAFIFPFNIMNTRWQLCLTNQFTMQTSRTVPYSYYNDFHASHTSLLGTTSVV